MKINVDKTKVMTIGKTVKKLDGKDNDQLETFKYMGIKNIHKDGKKHKEINRRNENTTLY